MRATVRMGVSLLAIFLASPALMGLPYKDYADRFVPKSGDRRRVAVAVSLSFEGSDRRIAEVDLLEGFLMIRFEGLAGIEHVPRTFPGGASDLLPHLRAMEADDLVMVALTKLRAPDAIGKDADHYDIGGSIRLLNVKTGKVVVETDYQKAKLPTTADYGEKIDLESGTADALAAYIASFYQASSVTMKTLPTCAAMDAAKDAETSNQYAEAYIILNDVIHRDPAKEAELRDRRDLAGMRSGKGPSSLPQAGAAPTEPTGAVSRGTDYLDPVNRGKLFPITNGSVSVKSQASVTGFSFSVSMMVKDPRAKGGVLIAGKTRNIYLALSPEAGNEPAVISISTQNTVTSREDDHPYELPRGVFPLNKLVRLTLRYDGSTLSFQINGQDVAAPLAKANFTQASLFFFSKLSTIYVQDAELQE